VTHRIVPQKTKVKIPQHNRLNADSFVSLKLRQQTKTAPIVLRSQ